MAIELNHETITTPPRPAASVVLLRDDPAQGLQVLLLRRHARSNVLAGAYVFPGGKLDEADADPSVMARLDQSSQALHQALAEPELGAAQACGLVVAALREMYGRYRERLWSPYGFRDAFNLERDWWATDVLGIDQGPILLAIENQRTGRVWARMRRSEVMARGLERAGFRRIASPAPVPSGLAR